MRTDADRSARRAACGAARLPRALLAAAFLAAVLAVRRERETARLTAQQAAARPASQAPQPVVPSQPPAARREPSPPGEFAPPA